MIVVPLIFNTLCLFCFYFWIKRKWKRTIFRHKMEFLAMKEHLSELEKQLEDAKQLTLTNIDPGNWSQFFHWFNVWFPGKADRINKAFPDLSDSEFRLFAYVACGFSYQEIADFMGIKKESVIDKARGIKKRLGLSGKIPYLAKSL